MFVPASESLAFGLVVIAMFCWGSWPFLRSLCIAKTPVFCQLYFFAQIMTAFFFCITLGDSIYANNQNPNFDNTQFSDIIRTPGSSARIFAIFLGGHFNAHADFLCALACSVLPFGVAFPVYAGWGLAQGTTLNFFILGMPGNPAYLFTGVLCALIAIAQLAYSDSYDKKKVYIPVDTSQIIYNPQHAVIIEVNDDMNNNFPSSSSNPLHAIDMKTSSAESQSVSRRTSLEDSKYSSMKSFIDTHKIITPSNTNNNLAFVQVISDVAGTSAEENRGNNKNNSNDDDKLPLSVEESRKWVGICIFAGLLNGLWSPLSSLGTVGPGAITNQYASLFIFQCGQFCAIPVFLNYYGMGTVWAPTYLRQLVELPFKDILFGLASGTVVGIGFTMYFVASSVISPAISFSTGACCPIFTIILGVVFAKQLSGASIGKTFLLLGAVSFYLLAIFLIANSKN